MTKSLRDKFDCSILIPVYGREDCLKDLLESLRGKVRNDCIWIIDDKSPSKATRDYLNSVKDKYNVVLGRKNVGFAKNVNRGLGRIKTKYVAIINSDIIIPEYEYPIKDCIDKLNRDPDIGIIGIQLRFQDGTIQHGGGYYNRPYKNMQHRFTYEKPTQKVFAVNDVDYVTGAFVVMNTCFLKSLGGMPIDYGKGYYEDPDLCVKVRLANKRVVYNGNVWSYHIGHQSFESAGIGHICEPNRKLFMQKHENNLDILQKRDGITVLTAIYGDYDRLKDPVVEDGIRYVCFTDNYRLKSDIWDIRYIEPAFPKDLCRSAKTYKIKPYDYVNTRYVLWVDASMQIVKPIKKRILSVLKGYPIAIHEHTLRTNIWQEAMEVVNTGKADRLKVELQLDQYDYYEYTREDHDNELLEATVIYYDLACDQIIKSFGDTWYRQVMQFSKRDQLSLPYVLWEYDIEINKLSGYVRESPYFKWYHHKK